jgi:phosphohistidine swiveling domain-containing protein
MPQAGVAWVAPQGAAQGLEAVRVPPVAEVGVGRQQQELAVVAPVGGLAEHRFVVSHGLQVPVVGGGVLRGVRCARDKIIHMPKLKRGRT